MSTNKKDLYVGTDKHRWWKEAVVYQVSLDTTDGENGTDKVTRYTQHLSLTPMAMAGAMFLVSRKSSTT